MDDLRTGGVIRVLRRRRGWRQQDLADRAGVSQSQVSLAERGHLATLRVRVVRAIGVALDLALPFDPHWRGADLAKLLDHDHATLVESIVSRLQDHGWEVLAEYSFNHYGDRGVVDVVGWHAATRTLLIVEVKTRIVDIQELLGTLSRKCRVVPMLLARERGWHASSIGRVVVIADSTVARTRISDHAATFVAVLPDRTRAVRQWVRRPDGPMAGLWFVRLTSRGDGMCSQGGPHRVRVPQTR